MTESDTGSTKPGERLSNFCTKRKFGIESEFYIWATKQLFKLYDIAKDGEVETLQQILKTWEESYSQIYGDKLSSGIFINHVYLTILTKSLLYLKTSPGSIYRVQIKNVISGDYFTATCRGKGDLFDFDLTKWLLHKLVRDESIEIFYEAIRTFSKYDLTLIHEDIFRGLYEELIEQTDRHKAGEYYTPSWLVDLILQKALAIWEDTTPPKILDPSCGSGTFLFSAIKYLKSRFNLSSEETLTHVAGFDINPIAALVSKVNSLLAIEEIKYPKLPIYVRDALRDEDLFNTSDDLNDFDLIVGNPPWLVLRSIKNKGYQDFVKKEMFKYKLINNGDIHLHTQLDTASLFFRKCANNYLKNRGIIAFVMPRSVLGSTHQHTNFRKFESPNTKLLTILDLENVQPLFKMPSCVLIALKGLNNSYPVFMEKYSGELPDYKDLSLPEIRCHLLVENKSYTPPVNGQKNSYYYDKFKVGVSIFPRSLYFVDLESITNNSISVSTSKAILRIVKEPWKCKLQGEIETNFLYCTVLPWEMVPFGYFNMHPIILPLSVTENKYKLLDLKEIKNRGYFGAYNFFVQAQRIWDENKTIKSNERFPRLIDRLNYNNLLSFQHPDSRYVVLFNATGKDITSCVISKSDLVQFHVGNSTIYPQAFVADVKTWYFETNSSNEAYYLSAILNSAVLSKLIKPYQPRGLFGARAIHRRPLQFPIPRFDNENQLHLKLASLGEKMHKKVKELTLKNISKNTIRKSLAVEITKADDLVHKLLQLQESK